MRQELEGLLIFQKTYRLRQCILFPHKLEWPALVKSWPFGLQDLKILEFQSKVCSEHSAQLAELRTIISKDMVAVVKGNQVVLNLNLCWVL